MAANIIDRLVKAKQHETEMIKIYNELALDCYERGDLKGHEYWIDRAFDIIDMYHALNNDLRKVREMEEL